MRIESRDYVGEMMAIRADYFSPNMHIGHVNTLNNQVTWHVLSHAEFDGLGAVSQVLRKLGYRVEALPTSRTVEPPKGKRLAAWKDYSAHVAKMDVTWKKPLNKIPGHKPPSVWNVFSIDETRRLHTLAAQQGVSINSYMLAILNTLVANEFIAPGTHYRWAIPTNMRGGLRLPSDTANHASALSLVLTHNTSAKEIHAQIRNLFERGHDWACYWTIRFMAKYLPKWLFRATLKKLDAGIQICGCLTNVGDWNTAAPGQAPNPNEGVILVPIHDYKSPIAAGMVTLNGRLSIALEIHDSLGVSLQDKQRILSQWKEIALTNKADQRAA